MPEREGYAHGVPGWVDLATTDLDGAKDFYSALFDWDSAEVEMDGEPSGYTIFTKGGKKVAGLGELPEGAGMPPVWSTYISVDDLDAAVEAALEAGGSVFMPATEVGDTGRMAFLTDPTGAFIGLWQAGTHRGADIVNDHGTYTWSELLTDDTEKAAKFYSDVFGYRTETSDMENGSTYTSFWASGNIEGNAAAGMMSRTSDMGDFPNYWGVYFAVDDCETTAKAAAANGGAVIVPPFTATGVGRIAVLRDPQGGVFSVIQYDEPQR